MVQQNPPKAPGRTGTELRDRTWQMINKANLDYAPKYIGLGDDTGGRVYPIDGLIRTPMGYYRLAEDMRDGTRVLLHSYERGQLTGVEQNGRIVLAPGASDVYGLSARRQVRGTIFRDDMNHDIRYLETCFQRDLNLHVEEMVRPPRRAGEKSLRTVRLANSRVAFGIYETEAGNWKVRLYTSLRPAWQKASRFVDADDRPQRRLRDRLYSVAHDLHEFDRYDEALHYVRRFWKNEANFIFKGRTSLTDPAKFSGGGKFKTALLGSVFHFFDTKAYRDWLRAVAVGVGVGFIGALASGTPLIGAAVGLGTTLLWATVEKGVENIVALREMKKISRAVEEKFAVLRPYFEQNLIGQYLRKDAATEKRFRKKLDKDVAGHLRLLSQSEADMNYDDGELAAPNNPFKDFERLSSAPHRYFAAQFDASHADKGLLACLYPNGLLSLIHIDSQTRATRHYVTYTERFNLFEKDANRKHLDPALTRLPGAGPVHKITHRRGKDFRYASMNGPEFMAALMAKSGTEVRDMSVFGLKLADIFNVGATEGIVPKAKETVPVHVLIAATAPD